MSDAPDARPHGAVKAALALDAGPVPTRLYATTRQVYRLPVVAPKTLMLGAADAGMKPDDGSPLFELRHVAPYSEIGFGPLSLLKLTVTIPPAVETVSPVGAAGVAGITNAAP